MRHVGTLALASLIGIMALIGLWGGIVTWMRWDRALAERNLEAELTALSNRADDRIDTILRGIDRGLVLLRQNWLANRPDLTGQVEDMIVAGRGSLVLQTAITDANGVIVYANRDRHPAAADIADRPFFRELQDSGSDRLFISGRMTDYFVPGPSLITARPLFDENGRPNGAVLMWIAADRLFHGLRINGYDIGGQLQLAGGDGRVRACALPGKSESGRCDEDLSGQPFLTMPPGTIGPLRLGATPAMPEGRTGVFRVMRDFPLTMVALRDDAGVEAMFSRRHRPLQIVGAVASLAIILCLFAVILITSRSHRAMAIAHHREQLWRAALESVGVGTWEWIRSTDRTELSEKARTFLGLSSSLVENGLSVWRDLIPAEDWKRIIGELDEFLSGDIDSYQVEHRFRRGDGEYVWVLARGLALERGAQGRAERTIGVLIDLGERKVLETALAKATDDARRTTAKLSELAVTDSLTGVLNRRGFMENAVASATGSTPAVLVIDLDRLRAINDGFGYEGGDAVLRTVARRIQRVLRGKGIIGRIGGDAFAVLLPDTHDEPESATAEALRAAITDTTVPLPDSRETLITASIGLAVADGPSADLRALLEHADRAMRQAKAEGNNRVVRYHDAQTAATPLPPV